MSLLLTSYYKNNYISLFQQGGLLDTLKDLFLDLLGGLTAVWRFFMKKITAEKSQYRFWRNGGCDRFQLSFGNRRGEGQNQNFGGLRLVSRLQSGGRKKQRTISL